MFAHPMFPGKFLFSDVTYASYLDQLGEEPMTGPMFRHLKFSKFAYQMLLWFETESSLEAVKLTTSVLVEVQKIPLSVWLNHHYQLTTTGVPSLVKNVNDFCWQRLPFKEMGNGSFELKRTDEEVARHLTLCADPREYVDLQDEQELLVTKIARRMDMSFEPCSVRHGIGIQSI